MVELRTGKREMKWALRYHDEKLGRRRIPFGSQCTIPYMAGQNPHRRYSEANQASCIPNFPPSWILHIGSIFILHLSVSSSTQSLPENMMLNPPSLSLHALIMSSHRVQCIPSSAYTKYSTHGVQHPPKNHYLSASLHWFWLLLGWQLNVASCSRRTSQQVRQPPASSSHKLKSIVNLSDSHHCVLTRWGIAYQYASRLPIDSVQIDVLSILPQFRLISASKCMSKLTWS